MELKAAEECLTDRLNALSDEDILLELLVECLHAFVVSNFCGISKCMKNEDLIPPELCTTEMQEAIFKDMSFGVNTPFSSTRHIELLWYAKQIVGQNRFHLSAFEHELWLFRVYQIWSAILEERSVEIKKLMDESVLRLDKYLTDSRPVITGSLIVQYLLEKAFLQLNYFEKSKARLLFNDAAKAAGIELELDGALGKRTRFQEKSLAQLKLTVIAEPNEHILDAESDLPIDCKNTDDTFYESVLFDDENSTKNLSEEQLACILGLGISESNMSADDNISAEVAMVYFNEVIQQRRNWGIQVRALVERSRLEMKNPRKVERACSQMEEVVRILEGLNNKVETEQEKSHRLRMLFSTAPLPFWKVKELQARILISLGCVAEALLIFESLKMWENVVECYKSLGQQEKAERLVRDLLDRDANAKNWCLLGDITQNPEHYLKAIEVSGDKSARACTALGRIMLVRKDYVKALPYFKRSVELQPFQIGVWFNLGYCAMQQQEYSEAVSAYHRCVSYEPEHFEAWNNMAACYVNLGQKQRAQKVLQEALKLNYEHWKVWENLMLISVDIGDFNQAIAAINKMLDLDPKKQIDELPLEMVLTTLLHSPLESWAKLKKHVLEILSRISTRQSLSPKMLRLYAEIKKPDPESTDTGSWSAYVQLLEKAAQRDKNDSKSATDFANLLENTINIITAMRNLWKVQGLQENQISSQVKLRLRPILTRIEKEFGSECSGTDDQQLKAIYAKASAMICT